MSANLAYCRQCGESNDPRSRFCHNCGAMMSGQASFVPAATPMKKSSNSCLTGCLVGLLVIVCLGIVGVTGAGFMFREEIGRFVDTIRDSNPSSPIAGPLNSGSNRQTGSNALAVTSAEEGIVTAPNGASITIPSGAVPVTDNGSSGTMVFSIDVDEGRTPSLAGAFAPVGPIYNLGPEGFVFSTPIEVSLPIPDDVDPELVLGALTADTQTGEWQLVPGMVDIEARTVTFETTHFSSWGIFGSCIGPSFGVCEYLESGRRWAAENGGWIEVINNHSRGSGSFPGAQHKPLSTGYGVCIQSYTFDNPADAWNWTEPIDWKIWARDSDTTKFWLPSGQFNLIEVIHLSEINVDPLYVPAYTTYWRPLGPHTLAAGETLRFSSAPFDSFVDYTEGRPPCWGEVTTSVGTGDVQVTLSWHAYADIDLYVTDPTGEEVYYGNDIVSSGGQLDRDNTCGNYVQDQPENIFWPVDGAPSGEYRVSVDYFGDCESTGPVQWTVRTVVGGVVQTYTGTLSGESERQEVATFSIP